jgi:hypothetical protein
MWEFMFWSDTSLKSISVPPSLSLSLSLFLYAPPFPRWISDSQISSTIDWKQEQPARDDRYKLLQSYTAMKDGGEGGGWIIVIQKSPKAYTDHLVILEAFIFFLKASTFFPPCFLYSPPWNRAAPLAVGMLCRPPQDQRQICFGMHDASAGWDSWV